MIHAEGIHKSYNGTRALDGFSLQVNEGELLGLVGPNGAGKTTFIKILGTLIRPDAGAVRVAGLEVSDNRHAVRGVIGYMPDHAGLYQDMRVREFLEFFVDAFRLRSRRPEAVERALRQSGLADRSESFVEELSLGMKQRLVLAKTLLHDPKVLLLDEPATGLDPLARIELRQELTRLNAAGVTILISSHILADLEDICTRVAFIAQGRNAGDGAGDLPAETQSRQPAQIYEIDVIGNAGVAAEHARGLPGVTVLESSGSRLMVEAVAGDEAAAALLRQLVSGGVAVVRFDRAASSLEDRYIRVFGNKSGESR
jgi:ABC-2 type transport system ATP-binding protein